MISEWDDMELDHLGDDGPKPALGGGAAAGGTALFVLVCTLTAFLFSGQSLVIAAATFFGMVLLVVGINRLYDRYVL